MPNLCSDDYIMQDTGKNSGAPPSTPPILALFYMEIKLKATLPYGSVHVTVSDPDNWCEPRFTEP